MPISPINWLQGEAKGYSTPGDLLENAIAGYKMAREPKRISQEEQQRELNNRLLGHQGTHAEQVNQYYPQLKEQQLEKGGYENELAKLNLGAAPEDIRQRQLANQLSINDQELKNYIQERFGLDQAEADLLFKRAQAKKAEAESKFAHTSNMTAEQKNALAAGYIPGSKEYQEIMRGGLGIFEPPKDQQGNPIPVPRHAISLVGKSAQERGHYETEMRKNVERGEAAKRADVELRKIIDITKSNPKLNRSYSYIASDPELLNPGTWQKAIRGLNEQEQTQLDLLVKSTNKLVLAQEDTSPGRGSDLRRKLQIASKPGAGMTDAARIGIAESTMKENAPLIAYADEAAPFVGSVYIPYQAKNYKTPEKELTESLSGNNNQKTVAIRNKTTGQIERVTIEEARKRGAMK